MRSVLQVATIKATVSIRFSKMKIYKIKNLNIMYFSFRETTFQIVSRDFTRSSDVLKIKNQISWFLVENIRLV